MIPITYSLIDLPVAAKSIIHKSYFLANVEAYRGRLHVEKSNQSKTLFSEVPLLPKANIESFEGRIIWATEDYNEFENHSFHGVIEEASFGHIIPRVQKSKEKQKKRVKEKAEVFTPSWVCNMQNNLIDDTVLYPGAFNIILESKKQWTATSEKVKFTENYSWLHYVTEKRLEITCGEAPYLFSPYDTVTGELIPVQDEQGTWRRIGLLDRKLRVLSENTNDELTWIDAAWHALRATYGYEWQGDNLLLARLNMVNTFNAYYVNKWHKRADDELIIKATKIASQQLWQMDGLKMVEPFSCSNSCESCLKKRRVGHDGKLPLIIMGKETKPFEALFSFEEFNK